MRFIVSHHAPARLFFLSWSSKLIIHYFGANYRFEHYHPQLLDDHYLQCYSRACAVITFHTWILNAHARD